MGVYKYNITIVIIRNTKSQRPRQEKPRTGNNNLRLDHGLG